MRDTLQKLLETFCAGSDASFTMKEEGAELLLDGFTISLDMEGELLRFRTALGLLPQACAGKLCMAMLQADNLLQDSRCFTLALDEEGQEMRLHICWPAARLDGTSFANLCRNLLVVAQDWMFRLEELQREAAEEERNMPAGSAADQNLLRI